jgi:hypothetical protein
MNIHLYTHRFVEAACKNANIHILKFLLAKRCKYTPKALCTAAEHCTKEQLTAVMRAGIKGDSSAIAHAAKR